MADIKAALRMEEEALRKMKRNQLVHEAQTHGISNPLCANGTSTTPIPTNRQQSNTSTPDLMSFNESLLSKEKTTQDWISLDSTTAKADTNPQYNAAIKNVMALYGTSTNVSASQSFTQQQWLPLGCVANQTVSHRSVFSSSSMIPPQSQFAQGFSHASAAYPQTQGRPMSLVSQQKIPHRSSFSHSSQYTSPHEHIGKTNSHPKELNLFGKSTTMPPGFSSELAARRGSWKSFEDDRSLSNNGPQAWSSTREEVNFANFDNKGAAQSISTTSSFNTASSLNAEESEHMNSIFDSWFNDGKWGKMDVTPSPKREIASFQPPNWIDLDPLNKPESAENTSVDQSKQATVHSKSNVNASQTDSGMKYHKRQLSDYSQSEQHGTTTIGYITELDNFAKTVENLRSKYTHVDLLSNPGHVICNMMSQNQWVNENGVQTHHEDIETTVRISVIADGISQPVTFECDVNASIEHIVSQALCIAYEDISLVSADDFSFKVVGRQEYLLSKTQLSSYQYVQECCKYERNVELELLHRSKIDYSLKRTAEDDAKINTKQEFRELVGKPPGIVTRENILILWEAFYRETDKLINQLENDVSSDSTSQVMQQQCERIVQTVHAMCSALGNMETVQVTEGVKNLRAAVNRPTSPPSRKSTTSVVHDLVGLESTAKSEDTRKSARYNKVNDALDNLTSYLMDFVEIYCQSCEVDFFSNDPSPPKPLHVKQILSTNIKDLYSVNIVSLHRVPKTWEALCEEFFAVCTLWHGDQRISHKSMQTQHRKISKAFSQRIVWDEWIDFDVAVHDLPLEAVLKVSIYGASPSDEKSSPKCFSQINVPLYNQNRILKHSSHVFGMWDMTPAGSKVTGDGQMLIHHCASDIANTESVALIVNFSEEKVLENVVKFPDYYSAVENGSGTWRDMASVPTDTRQSLEKLMSRAKSMVGPLCSLQKKEKELLWQHRDVVSAPKEDGSPGISLPLILRCVPSWSPNSYYAQDAYNLLAVWPKTPQPEESLALLTATFTDRRVRSAATRWLEGAGDMDISSWLPQLVQALKWEQWHDSPLMKLILRRAIGSVRIAQKLFWLLHENMNDAVFERRFKVLQAALLVTCSAALKKEFQKEQYFLKIIHRVAESVKEAKDSAKASVLQEELSKVSSRVGGHKFRIPLNPACVVNGLNVKSSSHYNSNAVPIKVAFTNAEAPREEISVMYKVGDDLRQDALTMQLIRVMDRMWLAEGLDLRIMTFECLPTGVNQGMVELISDSRTFREIQSSYGLTGAFKDRPIAEWLQKYNPTGISYEKAVENFTLSCAGYCVATYVLGICDRHNDNIMLRRTGHLFHIDFARFLGHAQMFGNIKRDRAPFVLTSDMAYVINGGDRPSSQFQDFVDICCRAFNIVRRQFHVLINLLSLMLNCGIPELSGKSDLKYVYDALRPNASDTEATTMFTKLIDASLSSSFTRFNFFIHNLAQMRFHGNESEEDRRTLSFAPQLRGYREEDGVITTATVVGFQKRYCPEKYYLYCVRVVREKPSTRTVDAYVFRTFDEFEELHEKLAYACQNVGLPSFPSNLIVGRSQVKQVAERRKAKLNSYLSALLKSKRNVAMHDLVYTFFHPILRDEEKEVTTSLRTPDVVGGEIKVSLHYKNSALYIMIMHCKNLSPINGSDPDPYVKTYLLPDHGHVTKKKTKVARKTLHPTYNEMLIYEMPLDEINRRQLQISVWNYETLQENDFLGAASIDLSSVDLAAETATWYKLKSSF